MIQVYSIFIKVVAILITFGLAVFVHEFGHMFFALLRGVGVESFAIGMGPIIGWSWRGRRVQICWKWRGIDFSLRWLPVGGFVKLVNPHRPPESAPTAEGAAGNAAAPPLPGAPVPAQAGEATGEDKSLAESSYDDLYALSDKDTLTKLLVFGGGVFMNFVTAIVAMALLLWIGQEIPLVKFVVEKVTPGSPTAAAGLQPGDVVTAVDGKPVVYIQDFAKVVDDLFDKSAGPKAKPQDEKNARIDFTLTVRRGNAFTPLPFHGITPRQFAEIFTSDSLQLRIPPVIGDVVPSTPAWRAGIKVGDRVLSVNGTPIDSFGGMAEIIRAHADQPCTLTVLRKGQDVTLHVTPMQNVLEGQSGVIGVSAASEATRLERVANPLRALWLAPANTWDRLAFLARSQKDFLQRATLKQYGQNLGGPITIFMLTAHSAGRGLRDAVSWFINLNLLLLILNILPIPVLDGGFILLSLIEGVIRRPVPPRILGPIYTTFVIFFICLIVAISLLDISRLF